ncbi:SDR family oxidoreductase [Streptomyces polygonati]|uniref:SDR family oxidoreductase n=1 Tax=Streptomyces polygonati TaxID=1617087 RepID=A0ABV8HXT3_9ACTN
MDAPILVTGGTGLLGRLLVPRLLAADRRVRVLSRRPHDDEDGVEYVLGDLSTGGTRVAQAVEGVSAIVHLASRSKGDAEATRNLVRAAARATGAGGARDEQPGPGGTDPAAGPAAGPPHLVFISVVGADTVSQAYMRSKYDAERVITDSELPWTIIRVTQFYDLVLDSLRTGSRSPLLPMPAGVPLQPVDADETAARLVELALGEPAGHVPDLAGPQRTDAGTLTRAYLRAAGRRRLLLPVPLPGVLPGARAIKRGALAPAPGAPYTAGSTTWEEFLSTAEL